MVIHKLPKNWQENILTVVCGVAIKEGQVSKYWNEVTCQNCLRLMESDGYNFSPYSRNCPHHAYEKTLDNGQIKYRSFCTFAVLTRCRRRSCPILNKGIKKYER